MERTELVHDFIRRLQEMEQTKSVSRLAELFGDNAELENPASRDVEKGREGAERFWERYLNAFDDIHSEFKQVREEGGKAILEWTSDGHLRNGRPIRYQGRSELVIEGDQIRRFKSVYDTTPFTMH